MMETLQSELDKRAQEMRIKGPLWLAGLPVVEVLSDTETTKQNFSAMCEQLKESHQEHARDSG